MKKKKTKEKTSKKGKKREQKNKEKKKSKKKALISKKSKDSSVKEELELEEKIEEFHSFIKNSPIISSSPTLSQKPQQEQLEKEVSSAPTRTKTKDKKNAFQKYSSKYEETGYKSIEEKQKVDENAKIMKVPPLIIEKNKINLKQEQEFNFTPKIPELEQKTQRSSEKDYVIKVRKKEQTQETPFEQLRKEYE